MIHRYFPLVLGILVICLFIPTVVQACPSCNFINDPIMRGFNWSILFLMAMPFTVVGLIGGSVFYTYKRANNADIQRSRSDTD